jgi:hypothetical protein
MIIYSNSCSYGVTSDGKVYSEYVAQHFNAKLINHGLAGCCNEQIIRVTTRDILTLVQTHDPMDILVLVGLSNTFRGEFWGKTVASFNDGHFCSFNSVSTSEQQLYIKEFYKIYDQEAAITNLLQQLVLFTAFLKQTGVRYLIWANSPDIKSIDWEADFVKPFYKEIINDSNIISLFDFNFIQHVEQLGCHTMDKPYNHGGHPDTIGHKLMSDWLIKNIIKQL